MDREGFKWLVARVVDSLPEEFSTKLENIDVVVEDWPTQGQLAEARLRRGRTLLGLYEGVPLTRRSSHYGLVPPDKITIFQKPIEAKSRYDAQITAEIQRVVRHEIAHHFGMTVWQAKPWQVAERVSQETGVKVIAARDGMRFEFSQLD